MLKALVALTRTPQNNLRIFQVVYYIIIFFFLNNNFVCRMGI